MPNVELEFNEAFPVRKQVFLLKSSTQSGVETWTDWEGHLISFP
jgi:hypothetical protein